MNVILFDTAAREKLFPLTLTRAVADLRMGILTIKERWSKLLSARVFVLTEPYLQPLYQNIAAGEYIFIDSSVFPEDELVSKIKKLKEGAGIRDGDGLVAARITINGVPSLDDLDSLLHNETSAVVRRLAYPYQIFQWNGEMLELDFDLVCKGRISTDANDSVHLVKSSRIFIEETAAIHFSVLNASTGPIYIGPNTTIMEGCFIRGPFALCEGAVLKMGTKIYGATTIGPGSTVGGEIKNSILTGYSNKGHDGYLGDSVMGEWCNLGAGTSNSNLKNNASVIKLWNYQRGEFLPAGNKCGVIMGDYTRTAINSSINTGSVIGVGCNVFGEGLLPKFIPDFTWGSGIGVHYEFAKALTDISNWKKMKNKSLSDEEKGILKHIFERLVESHT